MKQAFHSRFVVKFTVLALSLVGVFPMLIGCASTAGKAAAFTYGSLFLTDFALTPVRSFLGTQALNIINSL